MSFLFLHTRLDTRPTPRLTRTRGMSLIEVLIAIAVFTISVASIGAMGVIGMTSTENALDRTHATLALQEGASALRSIRNENYAQLTPGTYGIALVSGKWTLTPTPDTTGKFTRTITLVDVGTDRKEATLSVSWSNMIGRGGEVQTSVLLNKLFGSAWNQTTITDFSGGKNEGTNVTTQGDGAVSLGLYGDRTAMSTKASYDAPGENTVTAMKESNGILYVALSGVSGNFIESLDPGDLSKGILAPLHRRDVGARVSAIAAVGEYLFLGTEGDDREVLALQQNDLGIAYTLDLPGGEDVRGLSATGTTLFVGRMESPTSPELLALNVSTPTAGMPTIASYDFSGNILTLVQHGTLLFAGTSNNSAEVIELATSDLSLKDTLNLQGPSDVTTMTIEGNTLYVGREVSSSPEVSRIDISEPISMLGTTGSIDTPSTPTGMTVGSEGRLYVSTALPNSEVLIYDLPSLTGPLVYDEQRGAGASALTSFGQYVAIGLSNNSTEVVIISGGDPSWGTLTTAGSFDSAGSADGRAIAQNGTMAYLGTLTSTGAEFVILDTSNASSPLQRGSLEIGADVNAIAISGPYAYLATSDNNRELIIVNIANPSNPTIVGSYNVPTNIDALSIAISGSFLVIGTANSSSPTGKEVTLLNVNIPSAPMLVAQLEIGDDVNGLSFLGTDFIVCATANNAKELMILDARTPGSLREYSSYNTTGTANGLAVTTLGSDRFVLLTEDNGASPDLYFFTFNTASGGSVLRSFIDLSATERSAVYVNGFLFVANDLNGGSVVTIDPSNISAPLVRGTYRVGSTVNSITAYQLTLSLASIDNTREYITLVPTPLPTELTRRGWFTSSAFDSGSPTVTWGTLLFSSTGTGTVKVQIRTAGTKEGLMDAPWVGEGGLIGEYYATSGAPVIPWVNTGGRQWISYRVELSGDGVVAPSLTDTTITYQ